MLCEFRPDENVDRISAVRFPLAAFPLQRVLVWTDAVNRVDATVYYSPTNSVNGTSMVSVHISAVKWLDLNRPQMRAIAPSAGGQMTGAPVTSTATASTTTPEAPTKLFP